MKKQPKMQLVYTNTIRWRIAKDELPNRKTRYAGKYGVLVLAFDLDEFIDSGSCDPAHICYDFKKKQFLSLAHGYKGAVVWIPTNVTHWLPLPPIPVIEENVEQWKKGIKKAADNNRKVLKEEIIKMHSLPEPKIAVSKLGFKYFKGSDKLSKKFVEI